MSGPKTIEEKGKQNSCNDAADSEKPVMYFAMKTYKGVVMYNNEIEEIEKMDTRDNDIWVCSFPRSGNIIIYAITKTRLYNFDPLKRHFYIVKLWFTGVYIIFFLFLLKKHRLWVLVRTASPRRFLRVPIIYVLSRNMKTIRTFI